MNKLPFNVIIFDKDDEPTSRCMFPTERAARKRYEKAIVSAECANVGRIQLSEWLFPGTSDVLGEWTPRESDVQTAGYIVQSIRTLDKRQNVSPIGGEFFDNDADAVEYAESLAKKWSVNNPGLIVFKAVKHVQKVESKFTVATKIRVLDVE